MAKDAKSLTLSLLREIRREQTEQRSRLLGFADQLRRFDRRVEQHFLGLVRRLGELNSTAGRC